MFRRPTLRRTRSGCGGSASIRMVFASLTCLVAYPALSAQATVQVLAQWQGASAGEQFGIAIALGGDANGDGSADLAVGASTSDQGGANSGKVAIYFGRPTPGSAPDLVLIGDAGSFFGSAVSWAGDVNRDGYDDLLVGAYRHASGGTNTGRAYLFLGGRPMDPIADLILSGPGPGAYFGRAVCGAGDLNGDGYADFAIGAPRTTNGNVYVYWGSNPPNGTADLVLTGLALDDRFGSSLAAAGEADRTTGCDLLVGAPRASPEHLWQGAVYLFSGGAGMDANADWTVIGAEAGAGLGESVAGAGDVNGDGGADILAGAPYMNVSAHIDAGAAYLYYGGSRLDTVADFTVLGAATEDNLGASVAGCADMTESGYGHFIVGAPRSDAGGVDAGRVILSPGGNPPLQSQLLYFNGPGAGSFLGDAVAGVSPLFAASFTGDCPADFSAGAWGYGSGGAAYLYGQPGSCMGSTKDDPFPPPTGLSLRASVLVRSNPAREFVFLSVPEIGRAALADRAPERPQSILILAPDGRVVRRLPLFANSDTGEIAHWDGRNSLGVRAAGGVYFAVPFTRSGAGESIGLLLTE